MLVVFALLALARPALALKDREAREDLDVLRNKLNQIESSLQVRQMGLGEQLQAIREDLARINAKVDENRRSTKLAEKHLETAKIETREAFIKIDQDYQRHFQVLDENISSLLTGIKNLQGNIRTLSDNLQSMSEFEKKQEERISRIQVQLQGQLNAVVEEVGQENLRLRGEAAEMRKDIAAFQGLINTVDGRVQSLGSQLKDVVEGRIRRLENQIREVIVRQEKLAAAARAAPSGEHVVQEGETLSTIARRYGVTVETIMQVNGLSNANLIRVGQRLRIPGQ